VKLSESPFLSRFNTFCPYFFFVIPGLFYFFTACRTPGWVDATLIVSNVVNLELGSWVNYHNLFHILGYGWIRLFPDHNVHYYLVLLSAFFGALTVQLMFLVFLEVTSSRIVSGIGALILMISHSLWWHSTMLEVYTLNTAIIASMLLVLIRYNKAGKIINFYLSAFFLGLGCSNHVLMALFIPGFAAVIGLVIYRKKGLSFLRIMLVLGCFLLGIGLYLYVFTRDFRENVEVQKSREPAQSFIQVNVNAFKSTVDDTTGSDFKEYMFPKDASPGEKKFWRLNYLIIILYNYPSAAIVLALLGFYCFLKKRALRMFFFFYCTGLIAQVIWSSNFFIWDMYAFSLPVYLLLSLSGTLGVHFLFTSRKTGRILLLCLLPTFFTPPFLYEAISDGGKKDGIVKNYFRRYPEWEQAENSWDVVEYLTNPNKSSYDKVPQYVRRLFDVLPQKAHFWNSVGRADYPLRLYYGGIYKIRTDIKYHSLFSPFISHEEAKSEAIEMKTCLESGLPVYVASLAFPERLVLDQLLVLLDPGKDLDEAASLPLDRFITSFPGLTFEKIVLVEEDNVWIYRVVLEDQAQKTHDTGNVVSGAGAQSSGTHFL
jgi:hypothetical protein